MKINYKLYKAIRGGAYARWLPSSKIKLIYDKTYEGRNGNDTFNQLVKDIEIKRNYKLVTTRVE